MVSVLAAAPLSAGAHLVPAALPQGKGEGRLHLVSTYWPFDLLYSKPREATMVRAAPLRRRRAAAPACGLSLSHWVPVQAWEAGQRAR